MYPESLLQYFFSRVYPYCYYTIKRTRFQKNVRSGPQAVDPSLPNCPRMLSGIPENDPVR